MVHRERFRHMADPVIERKVDEFGSDKHLKEDEVGVTGIFDVVASDSRDKADVVRVEIHRAGLFAGIEDGHTPRAPHVILPLTGVRMPMKSAKTSRFHYHEGRGNLLGQRKLLLSTMRASPIAVFLLGFIARSLNV